MSQGWGTQPQKGSPEAWVGRWWEWGRGQRAVLGGFVAKPAFPQCPLLSLLHSLPPVSRCTQPLYLLGSVIATKYLLQPPPKQEYLELADFGWAALVTFLLSDAR